MNKKTKFLIVTLLAAFIFTGVFGTMTINADELDDSYFEEKYSYEETMPLVYSEEGFYEVLADNQYDPFNLNSRAFIGTVAVYLGKMLIGWIVAGTIKFVTGKSPSEWVALAMNRAWQFVKTKAGQFKSVFMDNNTAKVSYATDAQGCYVPPVGNKVCPRSIRPELNYGG